MTSSLENFKQQFFRGLPSLSSSPRPRIHLNNGGLAPISRVAAAKLQYWTQRFFEDGFYCDADYMQDVLHSRQSLAKLLNCQSTEIAFFQSTAGAVSQVAFGFGLQPGDEVVLWDQEYSSNLYPWREACVRAGGKLVEVPSLIDFSTPVEKILAACSAKTKIVAVSWVQFQTGARTDIQALVEECHRKNIFVFVDVIQGLGIHPFDFKNWKVDAVAGGSHKWLTSPVGVGYLALRQEHLHKIKPLSIGSSTYGTCDDPAMLECVAKNDVSRFEAGSKQVLEITALGASCDLIHQVGVAEIETEVLRLARRLRNGVESLGLQVHSSFTAKDHGSAMVNFTHPQMSKLQAALREHPVNFAMRGPGLRLSPHAFNSDQDIDVVLDIVSCC